MLAFLISERGVGVCAQPNFGGAILGVHGNKWDIDNERKRNSRVIKVGIIVRRLRCRWCICRGRKSRVSGDETERWLGAQRG
jgi:hypothetical protein